MHIIEGHPLLRNSLPENCQLACSYAATKLDDILHHLCTGDISIMELEEIEQAQDRMKLLCEANTEEDKAKGRSEHTEWKHALDERLKEYKLFEKHTNFLSHLCQNIPKHVAGMYMCLTFVLLILAIFLGVTEAFKELKSDYRRCKINTLCERRQDKIEILCFTAARPLVSFAWMFHVMKKEINSTIFNSIWHDKFQTTLAEKPMLHIAEIETCVWIPTFQHCLTLLKQLEDMSIRLDDVNNLPMDTDLEHELKLMCQGVSKCIGRSVSDNWIDTSVKRIQEYHKLCDYGAAAKLFIDLRNSLKLQGDFSDVEKIAAEVGVSFTILR